ncbi:MAG TPA: hypothetical protein VHO06_27735 [Polyangia bacterium]|nr:hypothetical protein [Polyangia bacterium]
MKRASLTVLPAAGALLLSLGGCGLISSDVFRVTFDLPTQTYTFDTSQWGNLPPGQVPTVPCTADADCCTAGSLAGIDCTTTPLVCKTTASPPSCAAEIPESIVTTIDLAMQVGSLAQYASLGNISISSITYAVSNNTLNVDLPPLNIYIAPMGVTDPTDPRALLFGQTAEIPAGTDPTMMVQLQPNAPSIFQMFTAHLSTPFNFIAATTVEIAAGTPVPNGHVTVAITGVISAQP